MTTSSPVARTGRVSGNSEPPSRVIRWLLTYATPRARDGKSIRYDAAGSSAMPRARVKDLSSHLVSTRPAWPEVRASSRCGFAPGRSGAFRGIRPIYLRLTTLRRGQNGARRACCRGFGPSSIGATGPPAGMEPATEPGRKAVGPSVLDQHPPGMVIAGLGAAAAARPTAARGFARHQAHIRHQLTGI